MNEQLQQLLEQHGVERFCDALGNLLANNAEKISQHYGTVRQDVYDITDALENLNKE